MKTVDYVVGWADGQFSFVPQTERAKERTPAQEVVFRNRAAALEYMRAAEAEGYRFGGAELVDSAGKRRAPYGYFVQNADGQLVQRGQDWEPSDPVFEPGDSLGIKNGREGIILKVITGEQAEQAGVGVMIVVEEREVTGAGIVAPSVPPEVLRIFNEHQAGERERVRRFGEVRPQIAMDFQGYRFVVVGGTLHYSTKWKFFHDFLQDYLPAVFGKEWGEAELAKRFEDRHQAVQFRQKCLEFMGKQERNADGFYAAMPNGPRSRILQLRIRPLHGPG